MPAQTPNITLTVNLLDIGGTADTNCKVIIALCGFRQSQPRITGTAMLAKVKDEYPLLSGSSLSILLFGNDQIDPGSGASPPQTFYSITIEDDKRRVIQAGIYQFTGPSGTAIDLSQATQLDVQPNHLDSVTPGVISLNGLTGAIQLLAGPGVTLTVVGNQITISAAAGAQVEQDLSSQAPGTAFTLAIAASASAPFMLFYNGVFQTGIYYSVSGTTLTTDFTVNLGESLYAIYVPA